MTFCLPSFSDFPFVNVIRKRGYTLTQCTVTHASQVITHNRNTDTVFCELYVSTLNQVCYFSWVLAVATWWWFPCKPKHVGAASVF